MTTRHIPTCPECGRDWSKKLPPFRKLRCQACIKHKQEAIDWAGTLFEAKVILRDKTKPVLTPEQCHAKAVTDKEMLYGKNKND
mgnify:CR=1 FL=1